MSTGAVTTGQASAPGAGPATQPARRGWRPRRPGHGHWRRNPWLRALFYLALFTFAVIYIYPFLIEAGTAFKTEPDASAHPVNPIPPHWSLGSFSGLAGQDFSRWFLNSVIVAVFVTIGRVLFDSMAGYALARLRFRGRSALFTLFVAVLAVPNVVLLVPKFLVIRQLGIYNSYSGMIIPILQDATGVFIMKQFFDSIPESIEEAARVDGAGLVRIYWSIILPMARPALMAITILSFQSSWNDLPDILIAQQSPSLNTLTTGVGRLVSGELGGGNQYTLKMAAALLMTLPVAIVFFTFQRHIVRTGEGGLKE